MFRIFAFSDLSKLKATTVNHSEPMHRERERERAGKCLREVLFDFCFVFSPQVAPFTAAVVGECAVQYVTETFVTNVPSQ